MWMYAKRFSVRPGMICMNCGQSVINIASDGDGFGYSAEIGVLWRMLHCGVCRTGMCYRTLLHYHESRLIFLYERWVDWCVWLFSGDRDFSSWGFPSGNELCGFNAGCCSKCGVDWHFSFYLRSIKNHYDIVIVTNICKICDGSRSLVSTKNCGRLYKV